MSDASTPGPCNVVITGAGLVTCLGLDRQATWAGILAGHCGVRPLTAIESTVPANRGGAEAPPLADADGTPREVAYLRAALAEAFQSAGLPTDAESAPSPYEPPRCGIVLGTTLHGMRSAGRFLRDDRMDTLRHFLAGSTLRDATANLGLTGPAITVCSACSSGLASIALGVTLLQSGVVDLAVAGGYDPISEYAYGGFNSMRLVSEGRLRPFARDRDGMKIGEGYGIVVLERRDDANARGATPLASILGFGESCDAHHLSKPHPEGIGAVRAIQAALAMSELTPDNVSMIAAHSTATPDNDAAEYAALSCVFDGVLPAIPVVAFKSHVAHTLGGAGAVELILSATALEQQTIPPCANVSADDVEFEGLHLAAGRPRRTPLHHTVNTSLGFGGSNTCMTLGPAGGMREARRTGASREAHQAVITGIGVLFPGTVGNEAFTSLIRRDADKPLAADTGGLEQIDFGDLLSARRVRRMSDYVKLTLAATTLAYRDAGIEDVPQFGQDCYALLGTAHGSTAFSERYYRQIVAEGIDAANPMLFAEGVPNAGAAHLSTMMGIRGLCQTVIGTRTAGLEALMLATARIQTGHWKRAIVSAADEFGALVNRTYAHFGLRAENRTRRWPGFTTGCGAVTFVLERDDAARDRGAHRWGVIERVAGGWCAGLRPLPAVRAVRRVWKEIGRPTYVIGSSNGTWLDRIEGAALSGRTASQHRETTFTTAYGHIAETFSATPLAGLAAVLLSGTMPRCVLDLLRGLRPARGDEEPDAAGVGVLGLDYAGTIIGIRAVPMGRQPSA